MMGQTVATRTENCPCPTCDTAPNGTLVANILDGGAYLSTGYTPVSVGGTLDLKCGIGFNANGSSFSCVYSSEYAGAFSSTLPTCAPDAPTPAPPPPTTEAPTTTVAVTTEAGVSTTKIINVTTYTIKSSLTVSFGSLPANATAESLAADT